MQEVPGRGKVKCRSTEKGEHLGRLMQVWRGWAGFNACTGPRRQDEQSELSVSMTC